MITSAIIFSLLSITIAVLSTHPRLMRSLSRKRKASHPLIMESKVPKMIKVDQDSRLLNLPDELLEHIVAYLDPESLYRVRLVTYHLKELSEPFIYRDFEILRWQQTDELVGIICRDPQRAEWFKSMLVSTKYDEHDGLDQLPFYLGRMRNMRNLVLETPDCNSKSPEQRVSWIRLQKEYEGIFARSSVAVPQEERLLPNLETCTMHFVDENVSLYPLTKYSSIFLHPTLRSLTLSCACTDKPDRILANHREHKHSTNLEYIHFEECDFEPKSLEILLKFPRALKSLKLSEGIRYSDDFGSRHSRMHGNINPTALSKALSASVAHSLESLSLSLGYRRSRTQNINIIGRHLDFTPLIQLKHLSLSLQTLNLIITRPTCDHTTHRRLPESLNHLTVFGIPLLNIRSKPPFPVPLCLITQKLAHGMPNINTLTQTYEYQAPRGRSSFGLIAPAGRGSESIIQRIVTMNKNHVKNHHNKYCWIYQDHGVRVLVNVETTPPGFIPPYLHNEEKPIRDLLWDSNDPPFEALAWEHKAREDARRKILLSQPGQPPSSTHATTNDGAIPLPPHFDDEENNMVTHPDPETGVLTQAFVPPTGPAAVQGNPLTIAAALLMDDDGDGGEGQDDLDDADLAIFNLHPQAQELFELLIMQNHVNP